MDKIDISRMPNIKNAVNNGADALSAFVRSIRGAGGTKAEKAYFEEIINRLNRQIKRLNEINNAIDEMIKDINKDVDISYRSASTIEPGDIDFNQYISQARVNYDKYITYHLFDNDKYYDTNIFSNKFNDLPAFLRSSDYEFYNTMNGLSQITDLSLWREAFLGQNTTFNNSYSQVRIQAALISLLENIPDTSLQSSMEEVTDLGKLRLKLEGENDKYYFSFCEYLYKFIKSSNSTGSAIMDEWFYFMSKDSGLTGEIKDIYSEMFKKYVFGDTAFELVDQLKDAFKGIDKIEDAIEYTDKVLTIVNHINTDYTRQIAYIDSFQESLAAAGFYYSGSPLVTALQDIKAQFTNDAYYVTKEVYKEIEKEGSKLTVKAVLEVVPELKLADSILKLFESGVKLAAGDQISNVQKLEGMQMYDLALTRSYENYIDMMQQGVADEEDMKNADKTLELLIANKISEYKAMNEISPSQLYNDKIKRLESMQNEISNSKAIEQIEYNKKIRDYVQENPDFSLNDILNL